MSVAEQYRDLIVNAILPKNELLEIFRSEISLHQLLEIFRSEISLHHAKEGYDYPTIRPPYSSQSL